MLIGARTGAWSGGEKLPYDAEVEYIESTSRAYTDVREYIVTGTMPDETFGFEIECLFKQGANTVYGQEPISWRSKNRIDNFSFDTRFMLSSYLTNGYAYCSGGPLFQYPQKQPSGVKLKFVFDDNVLSTDFAGSHTFGSSQSFASRCPVYLFAAYSENGVINPFGGRIYNVKMKKKGSLVSWLVPVRFTNERGVSEGAMYDKIGGGGMNRDGSPRDDGIYRNRGSGSFIIGPDK